MQTVACGDCRELYDVFTKLRRRADDLDKQPKFPGFFRPEIPPVILRDSKAGRLIWQKFVPSCPVEAKHSVETWKDPGRCPRCGNFMEKSGIAFRLWD